MIKVLDKNVADKIAAGEVVERPLSIVKELIENSIDAGATSIICEIKNGGKSYIRITDNGIGIPADETDTAFLRHATSKIQDVKDLNSLYTLGFRGEALASIAAVSRVEVLSKTNESKSGVRLLIHGGEIISKAPSGCPDGTTMVITDLFYNTPARHKFMKSDAAESSVIIDFISQIALAYKNIKFRLINNGKTLFSTNGNGNRLNIIANVYPSIDIKNLVKISGQNGNLKLEGYISTPAMSKTTRHSQIFFVNGRVVDSKVIEKGVKEGYKERLFEGRHPITFLFLDVEPGTLDVNIHPNKRQVRFDNETVIVDFIRDAIKGSLGTKEAVVKASNIFKLNDDTNGKIKEKIKSDILNSKKTEKVFAKDIPKAKSTISNSSNESKSDKPYFQKEQDKRAFREAVAKYNMEVLGLDDKFDSLKESENQTKVKEEQVDIQKFMSSNDDDRTVKEKNISYAVKSDDGNSVRDNKLEIEAPSNKPFNFKELNLIGAIFGTYIMATDEDSFYLLDQHACHERIFYEKLVGEYNKSEKYRQPIMMPLIINVELAVNERKYDWLTSLCDMGFTIEDFGNNSYRVTEIPTFMEIGEAEDFIKDYVDSINNNTKLENHVVINKLITKSCKSAIKAHDYINMDEMKALIKDLAGCVNPFSCPHGRPTFVKMTKYEIEKIFKRIQ